MEEVRLKKLLQLDGEDSLVQEEIRRLRNRREVYYNYGFIPGNFFLPSPGPGIRVVFVTVELRLSESEIRNRNKSRTGTPRAWKHSNLEWVRGEEKKKWKRYA